MRQCDHPSSTIRKQAERKGSREDRRGPVHGVGVGQKAEVQGTRLPRARRPAPSSSHYSKTFLLGDHFTFSLPALDLHGVHY